MLHIHGRSVCSLLKSKLWVGTSGHRDQHRGPAHLFTSAGFPPQKANMYVHPEVLPSILFLYATQCQTNTMSNDISCSDCFFSLAELGPGIMVQELGSRVAKMLQK